MLGDCATAGGFAHLVSTLVPYSPLEHPTLSSYSSCSSCSSCSYCSTTTTTTTTSSSNSSASSSSGCRVAESHSDLLRMLLSVPQRCAHLAAVLRSQQQQQQRSYPRSTLSQPAQEELPACLHTSPFVSQLTAPLFQARDDHRRETAPRTEKGRETQETEQQPEKWRETNTENETEKETQASTEKPGASLAERRESVGTFSSPLCSPHFVAYCLSLWCRTGHSVTAAQVLLHVLTSAHSRAYALQHAPAHAHLKATYHRVLSFLLFVSDPYSLEKLLLPLLCAPELRIHRHFVDVCAHAAQQNPALLSLFSHRLLLVVPTPPRALPTLVAILNGARGW
jgi:hypothetical protein